MPDWFYRTISRPMLYRLPAPMARTFALGVMGRLVRFPFGGTLIDLLGHMRADDRVSTMVLGIPFASPIGLGPGLDPNAQALPAFARFGVGFLDFGDVCRSSATPALVARHDAEQTIEFATPPRMGVDDALPKLEEAARSGQPILVRISASDPSDVREVMAKLVSCVWMFAVDCASEPMLEVAVSAASGVPVLAIVRHMEDVPKLPGAFGVGVRGVLVEGSPIREDGGLRVGAVAQTNALDLVKAIRKQFGPDVPILVRGGVHEVADALALQLVGASLIEIDSGLVFTGPGLIKSINESLLFEKVRDLPPPPPVRPAERSWFWTFLMGLGMIVGAILALVIASTRVVLPYDEQFIGMTCSQLRDLNPKLLPFLAHDRVTLSGTMFGIGILYAGLSLGGIRLGLHWAQMAVLSSCLVGFLTFFLFLGFGYLDTLHAFVTAILFQFLLLALFADLGTSLPHEQPPTRTSRAWRLSLWGQLLLVGHGIAVMVAGAVIGAYGLSVVFVPEDLDFLRTTPELLSAANPRLLPMIAHDRATFGGTLVCFGLCQLLTCLWGIRANQPWLWKTLFLAGLGYLPAIVVHHVVGYNDVGHLIPAYLGLVWYFVGVALLWPYQYAGVAR
jgi:dihydroorotate dehydrogenase